jgi:peroxiredoxin
MAAVRAAVAVLALAIAAPAAASPVLGKPAPAFQVLGADGKTHSLSQYKGKTVVLEWTNEGCPYVQKHYRSGAMQGLQKGAASDGTVWLTVISSAPGKQGYRSPEDAKSWKSANNASSTALLIDAKGEVGKAYEAKTTPHMYVVDKGGNLVYMGGIDDKPSADPASLKGAKNYVVAALADVQAGRAVATPASKPYGCSIKYAD